MQSSNTHSIHQFVPLVKKEWYGHYFGNLVTMQYVKKMCFFEGTKTRVQAGGVSAI
jgi:hypothetical protein